MEIPFSQAKILVIDDDADILDSIRSGLELPNITLEVLTAPNGMTGLQLAKTHFPDVIILDLQMPDIDGFTVLDEIRSDPILANTRVIMLTAQDSSKTMWEGIDRSLDDFMVKPFDLEELEARVYNQLLSLRP